MPYTTDSGSLRKVRIAIVGCGAIARLHARRLIDDGRAQIVGLCDDKLEYAVRFRDELGGQITTCSAISELLDSCELDAVLLCTPTLYHFEQTQLCRSRGLHVLCEKPLADSRERIIELIDATNRGGPLLSVAYQRRYDRLFRTLRREVQSGKWGPVRSITTHNSERWQQTISGTWRDDPRLNPGGFVGDAGSHKIDMLFFVTGLKPVEVFANSDRRGSQVEIVTTISGRLSNGVALSMSLIGNAQHWREDFQIHCAEADLSIRDNALWIGHENRFEPFTDLEPGSSPDVAFIDCILQGVPNQAPPECALSVFDFTRAVLDSARSGQVVRL